MNHRPNVLLVDDQKLTHALIGKALAEMDLSLMSATSGREALGIIRETDVSLVLMDLMMPGMDGIETAKRIREAMAPRLVPVIFITAASPNEDSVRRAYEMGAVDFLYKPVSPSVLKAKVGVFTELHRQRMELEQRQEEYRDIIEAVATGMLTVDMQWRVAEANGSACAQFQIPRDEFIGTQVEDILGCEGQELTEEVSGLLDNNVAFAMETLGHRSDGSHFNADLRGTAIMAHGEPCILMCVNDVSAYKRQETTCASDPAEGLVRPGDRHPGPDSLHECTPSLDHPAILEAVPIPIYFKDIQGVIVGCNRAFLEVFERGRDELVGKTVHELLPEQTAQSFELADQGLLSGHAKLQSVHAEVTNSHGTPLRMVFQKTVYSTDEASPAGIVGIITEVTKKDESASPVQDRDHLFEAVLSGMKAALLLYDQETGIVEEVNNVAEELLETPRNEMIGHPFTDITCPRLTCRDCDMCRSTQEPLLLNEMDTRLRRRDGITVPIHRSVFRISMGGRDKSVVIMFDNSRRKLLEQRLTRAQKLESLGTLASGIAHEINTPIQYVGDNLRFLEEAAGDLFAMLDTVEKRRAGLSNDYPDILEAIDRRDYPFFKQDVPESIGQSLDGINKVSSVVKSMMQFSQPGSGRRCRHDLNAAVQDTINVTRSAWTSCARVVTDLDDSLPNILCDPSEINQVILNLLMNATHAMADRYGEQCDERGVITISTRHAGDAAELTVEDTGIGIPDEIMDKIFDPFFTTKSVGRGTGQGLSIVHTAVVERHSGSIDIISTPGEGTQVRILLPFSQEKEGSSQ